MTNQKQKDKYLEEINKEVNDYINRLTYHVQRCSQQFANEVFKINKKYFEMKDE